MWKTMSITSVAISGYFNPLHIGHLELIKKARELGNKLIIIVNNDYQVKLKNRIPFLSECDRIKIMKEIKGVDEVFLSIDKDKTVCESLRKINPNIFANGGDRHNKEIPEAVVCQELNIKIIDGLGDKIRSSSEIITQANIIKINKNKN